MVISITMSEGVTSEWHLSLISLYKMYSICWHCTRVVDYVN